MKNNSIIEVVFFLATSRPICGDFFSLCTKPSEHTTTAAATTTARATALAFISNCSCLSAAGQSHLLPNGMAHRIFHAVPCHAMPCRTLATQPPSHPLDRSCAARRFISMLHLMFDSLFQVRLRCAFSLSISFLLSIFDTLEYVFKGVLDFYKPNHEIISFIG